MKALKLIPIFVTCLSLSLALNAQNKIKEKKPQSKSEGSPSSTSSSDQESGSGSQPAPVSPASVATQMSSVPTPVSVPGAIESNPVVQLINANFDTQTILSYSGNQVNAVRGAIGDQISNNQVQSNFNKNKSKSAAQQTAAIKVSVKTGNFDENAYSTNSDKDPADVEAALEKGSSFYQYTSTDELVSIAESTYTRIGIESLSYLENAVALIDTYLVDKTISSASDLPTDTTVSSLGTGATYEVLQMLNQYGAFGSSGDTIITASSLSSGEYLTATDSTSDYLPYLGTIIGKSTIDKNLKDSSGNPISVINVPTSNIRVAGANKFTLGSASATSTIDVSNKLPPVPYSDPDESPSDENVYIIGAVKDVFTAGNVNFNNTNDAEDHVLAIGAGDQVGVYHNITYTGSNLAIGQAGKTTDDTKTSVINDKRALLIQADISTGGNLAIGSLGQIQVKGATFTLGTANAATSDSDNLYVYANDLIEINGLSFGNTTRLDDVYMEANTINLKDLTFAAESDVLFRSGKGTIAFDTFNNPTVGAVNFTNVIHPDVRDTALVEDDFTYSGGQYGTIHNAVTVRAR